MNLRPEQYNKYIIEFIVEMFEENYSLEKIMYESGLHYEEIIAILNYAKVEIEKLREYIPNLTLNEDKIIICSDTHIGSKYENRTYLEDMVDYAIVNNIKSIVHGGDLLHSNKKGVKSDYEDLEDQLDHFLYYYSRARGVTNYVLLGNHDVHFMKKKPEAYEVISNRGDIKIIGAKRAYFNFNDLLISVFHKIDKYKMELPNIPADIYLYGHRHECRVKGNDIFIPTLSDDVKFYLDDKNKAGFLVMNDYGDIVTVDQVMVENKRLTKNESIYVKNKTL